MTAFVFPPLLSDKQEVTSLVLETSLRGKLKHCPESLSLIFILYWKRRLKTVVADSEETRSCHWWHPQRDEPNLVFLLHDSLFCPRWMGYILDLVLKVACKL